MNSSVLSLDQTLQNCSFFNLVSPLQYVGCQSEFTTSQRFFAGKTNKKPIKSISFGFTDFIALHSVVNRFAGSNRRYLLDGSLRRSRFESSA